MKGVPHLYIDTNIILDIIHKRWKPSIELLERAGQSHWLCSTSRFTMLEIVDIEQEESFILNFRKQGVSFSGIPRQLGRRRQIGQGLQGNELQAINTRLHKLLTTNLRLIKFKYPTTGEFWDRAEHFCATTNLSPQDAIHLASAEEIGCNIIVTRDSDFRDIAQGYIYTTLPEKIDEALARIESSRRGKMAKVMIKCPKTGKLVDTGIAMDKTSYETAPLTNNSVRCPECAGTHAWSKKDAILKS